MERVNLAVNLDDMKKKLQEVAAAEKRSASSSRLPRQSSYEHSSRPTFPGNGHVLGGQSSGNNAMYSTSSRTPVGAGHSFGASSISGSGVHHVSGVSSSSRSFGGGHIIGMMDRVCEFGIN